MIVTFDFDGTLFEQEPEHKIGKPIQPMIDLLKRLYEEGHIITILSGRTTGEIEAKIKEHGIEVHEINDKKIKEFDRFDTPSGKPYYDVFVENRSVNPDIMSADEIYEYIQSLQKTKETLKDLK